MINFPEKAAMCEETARIYDDLAERNNQTGSKAKAIEYWQKAAMIWKRATEYWLAAGDRSKAEDAWERFEATNRHCPTPDPTLFDELMPSPKAAVKVPEQASVPIAPAPVRSGFSGLSNLANSINLHGRVSGEYFNQSIQGNTRRSFLNPGGFYLSQAEFRADQTLNNLIWDASVRGRITSDTRTERRGESFHVLDSRLSLKSAEMLEFYRRRWEVDLAEYSEYYTSWSVASALLGSRGTYRWDNGFTVRAGGGRVHDVEHNSRWNRYAAFGRVEREDLWGWNLMLHGSRAWDDISEQNFFASRPGDQASRAVGMVAKREFLDGRVDLEAENDWSFHQVNRTATSRELQGLASRINLGWQGEKHRASARGERVTRDYNPLIGFAPQDVISSNFDFSGEPWDWFSYRVAYGVQEDNVENTKATTTRTQTPDLTYTVRPWLKSKHELARNIRWNSGASLFMVQAENKSIDLRNTTYRSGFDDRYRNLSFGMDYQHRFSDDRRISSPNADVRDNVVQTFARHEGTMSFLENRPYRVQARYSYQWTKDIVTGFKDRTSQVSLSSYLNLYPNLDWTTDASLMSARKGRPRTDNARRYIDSRLEYRFQMQKVTARAWGGFKWNDSNNDDKTQDVEETIGRGGIELSF